MSKYYPSSIWSRYSKKLSSRIENPKFAGALDSAPAQMRLVIGKEKNLTLYWIVDELDGVIADVKFQTIGSSSLIGAAEGACELLLRKNYDQARRITAELIDKQMRDKGDAQAFPPEVSSNLNLVLTAIDDAAQKCTDIPFADTYAAPPMTLDLENTGGYPGWKELKVVQKISIIEELIAKEIRPYIELDAGNVQVIDFVGGNQVIIAYEGSCTTCHSSTGATLSAIQQILQAKIDPELIVTPKL